ncbi:MAG: hypothetical protein KF773_03665 [Deltaproteobacteria bacterium]|nr:hypothetical protein [Deltaproteobacteria bacterium]
MSADAVVWGTLKDIRFVDSPASVKGEDIVAHCDGHVEPALDLEIEVDHALRGGVTGTVLLRVGAYQKQYFYPLPLRGQNGDIRWIGASTADSGPLLVGQKLGAAMHREPRTGLWSLMGESLFGNDSVGNVRFQAHSLDSCSEQPSHASMTLAQLRDKMAQCVSDISSEDRKRRISTRWGPESLSVPRYLSALCIKTNK